MNQNGLHRTLDRALALGDADTPGDDDWWSTEEWCEEIASVETILAGAPIDVWEDAGGRHVAVGNAPGREPWKGSRRSGETNAPGRREESAVLAGMAT